MKSGLEGKRVVVTGGTSGIGKAAAEAFLAEGCRVAVCDFRQDLIDALNGRKDPALFGAVADVTRPEQVRALLEQVKERFGGIDVMVNNAGVGNPYGFTFLPDSQWDKVMNVNLKAVISCCNLAIPYLEETGGCIVNTSSLGGRITSTVRSIYGVTKAGVNAYTKLLAQELAPRGIRVNAVAPGMIRTDMVTENNRHLKDINVLGGSSVMQRLGEPAEIAAGMVFLASELAGGVTGQVLEITGGKCIVQDPAWSWQQNWEELHV